MLSNQTSGLKHHPQVWYPPTSTKHLPYFHTTTNIMETQQPQPKTPLPNAKGLDDQHVKLQGQCE